MQLSGWGRCPCIEGELRLPIGRTSAGEFVATTSGSCEDAALGTALPGTRQLDRLRSFDEYGGRLYQSKDARKGTAAFRHRYPRSDKFQALRER
ncbi:hypothetical protein ACLUTX_06615 [Enterobacterales bacterium AE_CKDN230030158-1A_HGKHYDSX7]